MNEERAIETHPPPPDRMAWMLLILGGSLLAFFALAFNEFLLGFILPPETLPRAAIEKVRYSQLWFFIFALVLGIAGMAVRNSNLGRDAFSKRGYTETLLVFLAVMIPLVVVELTVRPFAPRAVKTWIFMRDDDLGWRLRPKSSDVWGGIPVRINGKGVRGPELAYERDPETYRILYLGDSVTFGFGIEDDLKTFPYQVEKVLEESTGIEVETINAGVGGYSPWQERIFFEKEGIKYQPDLVVIGFYLNDVTEKFLLPQFGGKEGSYQLNRAYNSQMDRWLRWSGAWAGIKSLNARIRFGEDIQKSALEIEATNIEKIIRQPNDPLIVEAWELTLDNLKGLVDSIRKTDTELLLLALPDKGQVENPEYGTAPQETLAKFAIDHEVPFLDLLPVMKRGTGGDRERLDLSFRDYSHPSPFGVKILAPEISEFIRMSFSLNKGAESAN